MTRHCRTCSPPPGPGLNLSNLTLGGEEESQEPHCTTTTDGFYYMSPAWVLLGCVWLVWGRRTLSHMQDLEVGLAAAGRGAVHDITSVMFQVERWRVIKPKNSQNESSKIELKDNFKYFYCF